MRNFKKVLFVSGAVLALSALAVPQLKQILKVGGVVGIVSAFGKDINKAFDKLQGKTEGVSTKTVVILSVGINRSSAIGIAQVMGPKSKVDQVVAVAQPEAELFGKEVRIRALIPVASKELTNIRRVDGVGVSGIVDLKL